MNNKYLAKFLNIIEKGGNALPHPATLFALFAFLVVLLSGFLSLFDIHAIHPRTQEMIEPVNLMSKNGLGKILNEMVTNFTSFAPLGTVLVAMLGIGIAESSGFIATVLRLLVTSAPKRLLTFVIVFTAILSNTASEVGYVLLVPLGAIIFLAVGRHPLAGMAAAFAGVSGGYSANLLLGTIDPLLAGLSQEAAHIIDPSYLVNPAANYYFMFVSTFFIALAGTWVTEKIVIPRLGIYDGNEKPEELRKLNQDEKRGLNFSIVAGLVLFSLILWGVIPENGYLRGDNGDLLHSPFLTGIVAIIFLGAAVLGVAYGIGAHTYKNDTDVMKGMGKAMETLGIYIVLTFFAAQFVAYFRWTNIGLIFAIKAAGFIETLNLGSIPLMIAFILLVGILNLFMGSASAKWAILAPAFIPMFMILGYSPELVQNTYRIGDSVTNIISPMMSYFALIVAFFQRYDKKAGIGTIIATMLPYTWFFFIVWVILLVFWLWMGWPVGPDSGLYYPGA